MGTFHVGCKVLNMADRAKAAVVPRVMVDTGSEYTFLPTATLSALGIKAEKSVQLVTANGEVLQRVVGYAMLKVDKFETVDEVVFAQKNDLLLLGARALEGMNVQVDPQRKRLVHAGPSPVAQLAGFETLEESRTYLLQREKELLAAKKKAPGKKR